MNIYRQREYDAIYQCLLEYEPYSHLPESYLKRATKLIERGCHNASIDKASERNIPIYWDEEEFIDQYSNIGYHIKMNIDITSPILENRPREIKYYLIEKIYNHSLKEYLLEHPMLDQEIMIKILDYLPIVNPLDLGKMTSIEMNPEISKPIIDKIKQRENEKIKIKYSTMYKCPRCFERKTTFNEVQKRRGDEGGTLQITCTACGHMWDKND